MNEFDIVRQYLAGIGPDRGVRLGVGDDGAIVHVPERSELVVSTDTLVEDVHFPADMAAEDVGWRALAVNLSDVAAMGATPMWFTLALSLPELDQDWLRGFSAGMRAGAERYSVALVGGDLTRGPLTITMTMLATQAVGGGLLRSGARAGDGIYVSGSLGGAAAGLADYPSANDAFRGAFARPEPRIDLGRSLVGLASAAIDISDGLLADLGHICHASRCGGTIVLADVPVAAGLKQQVPDRWADWVLAGGDDYELCFTVPPAGTAQLEDLAHRLSLPIARVGTIEADAGVRVEAAPEGWRASGETGYRHF